MEQKWPQTIWLVRHGQSAGNVARDSAEAAGLPLIDIAERDIDVPLSRWASNSRGRSANGSGDCRGPPTERRAVLPVCAGPRDRAVRDGGGGLAADAHMLRATSACARRNRHPRPADEVRHRRNTPIEEQRAHVGKFYFRPPGGESWCDVILRLRSVIDTITREYRGERVLIVAHQVIVNCFRYLLERMNEAQILDVDRVGDVPNCAVTSVRIRSHEGKNGKLVTRLVNFVAPLPRRVRRSRPRPTCRRRRSHEGHWLGTDADLVEVDDECLRRWPLPQPDADGDKEERGRVLIIAGSREMPGAVILAANAALNAGAGKLTVATAASVARLVAMAIPEARVIELAETEAGGIDRSAVERVRELLPNLDAVLIGPGMQDEPAVCDFCAELLQHLSTASAGSRRGRDGRCHIKHRTSRARRFSLRTRANSRI